MTIVQLAELHAKKVTWEKLIDAYSYGLPQEDIEYIKKQLMAAKISLTSIPDVRVKGKNIHVDSYSFSMSETFIEHNGHHIKYDSMQSFSNNFERIQKLMKDSNKTASFFLFFENAYADEPSIGQGSVGAAIIATMIAGLIGGPGAAVGVGIIAFGSLGYIIYHDPKLNKKVKLKCSEIAAKGDLDDETRAKLKQACDKAGRKSVPASKGRS